MLKPAPANHVARRVFHGFIERLRALYGEATSSTYKRMEPCGCTEHDPVEEGYGSGRPSTLHHLEKEIALAIDIAHEIGTAEALANARSLALHPLHYYRHLVEESGEAGFKSEHDYRDELAKLVQEQADIVIHDLQGAQDAAILEETLELIAQAECFAAKLRGRIRHG